MKWKATVQRHQYALKADDDTLLVILFATDDLFCAMCANLNGGERGQFHRYAKDSITMEALMDIYSTTARLQGFV